METLELFILTKAVLKMWNCFSWSYRTITSFSFSDNRYFLTGCQCPASSAVNPSGWRSKPIVTCKPLLNPRPWRSNRSPLSCPCSWDVACLRMYSYVNLISSLAALVWQVQLCNLTPILPSGRLLTQARTSFMRAQVLLSAGLSSIPHLSRLREPCSPQAAWSTSRSSEMTSQTHQPNNLASGSPVTCVPIILATDHIEDRDKLDKVWNTLIEQPMYSKPASSK